MIIGAIIVGLLIFALMVLCSIYTDKRCGGNFDAGVFMGVIITILMVFEICLVAEIIEKPKPSALDVYQGKTTLEYTIVDGTKIDSVVVFEEKNYGK